MQADVKALVNGRVFDGQRLHDGLTVVVVGERIAEVTQEATGAADFAETWDLEGRLLAPGLIDLQVNGGGGVLFNDDPGVEAIRAIGAAHRRFGTTGFLPTLISDTREAMARAVEAVRQAIAEGVPGVLGVHIEGPFLNPEYRGIHDARHFRDIGEQDIELLTSLDNARVLLTLAPEMVEGPVIRRLADAGVLVFGGHSGASYEQTREALDAGLCGFTHLFNAMTPFGSRAPGMVGAALEDRHSWAGLIADGHHVHPASFAVAVRARGRDRSLLVTDAMPTVGADDPSFDWNGETVTVADGCCRLANGRLAGSNLDMIAAVRNAGRFAGIDLTDALGMASRVPAQALGLGAELGMIRPGYRASLIELDDDLNVVRSWIDGEVEEVQPWK